MRVIAVASCKGGSGKTTLTGHIGVQAERAGAGPVAFLDADIQGSLAAWWREREAEAPWFAAATHAGIKADLAGLRALGVQGAFIDTPAGRDGPVGQAIRYSDLVLVPIRPSPHDIRAAGHVLELAQRYGKRSLFVLNAAIARSRLVEQAATLLRDHVEVAPVILHHRSDYAASMIDGRTVMELKRPGKSAAEIVELWNHVTTMLQPEQGLPCSGASGLTPAAAVVHDL